jgi:hypothetical protein
MQKQSRNQPAASTAEIEQPAGKYFRNQTLLATTVARFGQGMGKKPLAQQRKTKIGYGIPSDGPWRKPKKRLKTIIMKTG